MKEKLTRKSDEELALLFIKSNQKMIKYTETLDKLKKKRVKYLALQDKEIENSREIYREITIRKMALAIKGIIEEVIDKQ